MFRSCIATLIAVIFYGMPSLKAEAQALSRAEPIPAKYIGIWTYSNCRKPDIKITADTMSEIGKDELGNNAVVKTRKAFFNSKSELIVFEDLDKKSKSYIGWVIDPSMGDGNLLVTMSLDLSSDDKGDELFVDGNKGSRPNMSKCS